MAVRGNAVKFFSGFFNRIDVYRYRRKIGEMMHELMTHFFCDFVGVGNREVRKDRDIQFGMQTMTKPARSNLSHFFNSIDMLHRVTDFVDHIWLDAVEHSREDRLDRLPDDLHDRDRDEQTDNRIGDRIAEPDADSAEKHGQTCPAVDAGVITIGNERGTLNFFADFDAENGDRFVADEANDRSGDDCPEITNRLRMHKTADRFVTGDHRAERDREHDGNAGQIFDAAVSVSETLARFPARECERNPKRNRGRGIAKIMNRIGKKSDALGKINDNDLNGRSDKQPDERPFDRPNPTRGSSD